MALTGTVRIFPDTKYASYDFDVTEGRIVGVEFDGLTLAIGFYDDVEHIGAIDALVEQLMALREAALLRAAQPEAVAS